MSSNDRDLVIQQAVSERYGGIAEKQLASQTTPPSSVQFAMAAPTADAACCDDDCCSDGSASASAEEIKHAVQLYTDAESLASVPEGAVNASLGCGNPVAIAELSAGERVLDLGSGGGIDCFIASKQVGESGEVWGLDMTPQMIRLARRNAEQVDASNVQFRLGEIEDMPFDEGYFDAIISNCVINLSTDKAQVFREAFRVLKPGGRLRVSDIVWTKDVPLEERGDAESWAGCIAGALPLTEYLGGIEAAGFLEAKADYEENERGIASAYVTAVKPA
ncbi:MAG: arsenite methyltransferase [Chloroflexi bacterium]|nr:arsenite methyltransferase [Chloroflexota bacterium]MDA1145196.1 arsenite methyltransferase [Chloroflexota bacterium]